MSAKKPAAKAQEKTSKSVETAGATKHQPATAARESTRGMDARYNAGRRQNDRRQKESPVEKDAPVAVAQRPTERRAKVNRRRQIDPTTCERDYSPAEVEFMSALDDYKRRSGRMFPTCSEILEVFKALGYEKRPAPTSGFPPGAPELPTIAQPAEPASVPTTATDQAV